MIVNSSIRYVSFSEVLLVWNNNSLRRRSQWVPNLYHSFQSSSSLFSNFVFPLYFQKLTVIQGGPTGENLASGYPNASASIIAWGAERDSYNFKKGDFDTKTGHFTQLVWKNTTSVGCGRTECNGKGGDDAPGWYVVCEYWPHGNVIGQFQDNVQEEVPEDEQPEGPSDPQVPDDGKDDCPQGALCGAATQLVGDRLGLVVAIVGAILMME